MIVEMFIRFAWVQYMHLFRVDDVKRKVRKQTDINAVIRRRGAREKGSNGHLSRRALQQNEGRYFPDNSCL